jgi:hypothetical protein
MDEIFEIMNEKNIALAATPEKKSPLTPTKLKPCPPIPRVSVSLVKNTKSNSKELRKNKKPRSMVRVIKLPSSWSKAPVEEELAHLVPSGISVSRPSVQQENKKEMEDIPPFKDNVTVSQTNIKTDPAAKQTTPLTIETVKKRLWSKDNRQPCPASRQKRQMSTDSIPLAKRVKTEAAESESKLKDPKKEDGEIDEADLVPKMLPNAVRRAYKVYLIY